MAMAMQSFNACVRVVVVGRRVVYGSVRPCPRAAAFRLRRLSS